MKRNFSTLLFILLSVSAFAQQKDLDYYLSQADQHTPKLSDLKNQAASIGIDSAKLKAFYGPQIAANSNLLYAPVIKGWGYDDAISNGQNITGVITFSKEIVSKKQPPDPPQQFLHSKNNS